MEPEYVTLRSHTLGHCVVSASTSRLWLFYLVIKICTTL